MGCGDPLVFTGMPLAFAIRWMVTRLSSVKYSWPFSQTSAGKLPRDVPSMSNETSVRTKRVAHSGHSGVDGCPR